MCTNMKELQTISEKIFELEKKKKEKKKQIDALEKEIKQLKSETSSYMKKRQKSEITVKGLTILLTIFTKPQFDKDAFIANEKKGAELYRKYSKNIPMERVTVKIAK